MSVITTKTLPKASQRLAQALRAEARSIAAVSHENLALIHGVEAWGGAPMLILEYLPGGTLASHIEEKRLALPETLKVGMSLAQALQTMPKAGILHRDIKPSNIGFNGSVPKLLDFGLAKMLASESSNRQVGRYQEVGCPGLARSSGSSSIGFVGTPQYMSPEVFEQAALDPRADLWSLAMVLYECLAGCHPLSGNSLCELAKAVVQGEIPDIRQIRSDIPAHLAEWLGRALSNDRERRPHSASEFAEDLQSICGEFGPGIFQRIKPIPLT